MTPINVEENVKTNIGINNGTVSPTCVYCGTSPCYHVSFQGVNLVHTIMYDEQRLICGTCWSFMNKNGRIVTKILRACLYVDVLRRKLLARRKKAATTDVGSRFSTGYLAVQLWLQRNAYGRKKR